MLYIYNNFSHLNYYSTKVVSLSNIAKSDFEVAKIIFDAFCLQNEQLIMTKDRKLLDLKKVTFNKKIIQDVSNIKMLKYPE